MGKPYTKNIKTKKLNNLSIQEYTSLETSRDTKYEYHDGTVFAMAGGTLNHGLICGNIFGEMRSQLRNKQQNCTVMNSEIKLHIASKNAFLYPDAMVICGEIEKSDKELNAVTNPIVIIEVLSKSTESYDRGDKFYLYRQLKSLQEYILINQKKALVEVYKREADLWKITRVSGLDSELQIDALDISVDLREVYLDVAF